MGYRSQVQSVIYGEVAKVNAFLVKHKVVGNPVFDEFKEHLHIFEKDWKDVTSGTEVMKFIHLDSGDDSWKWYDDYDDVKAWHALLADAEESGLSYEFIRIGEETGDISEETGGDDVNYLLHVNQSIGNEF